MDRARGDFIPGDLVTISGNRFIILKKIDQFDYIYLVHREGRPSSDIYIGPEMQYILNEEHLPLDFHKIKYRRVK